MRIVEFGEWRPDLEGIEIGASQTIRNVLPGQGFYRPFRQVTPFTESIGSGNLPRGAISGVAPNDNVFMYVGTNNGGTGKLFELQENGSWTDVSKSAGYSLTPTGCWDMARFGDNIIAVSCSIDPQVYNTTSSTTFTDLSGTPPQGRSVKVLRDQVFISGQSADPTKVSWSAINDITGWTEGTDQAGGQTFPDVGECHGIYGTNVGYIFFDRAIYSAQYVGPPLVWQFDKISDGRGAIGREVIAEFGDVIFFLAEDGFWMLQGGALTPIGHEKVDFTILNNLNRANLWLASTSVDPVRKLVLFSYPSVDEPNAGCTRIAAYSWPTGRWSDAEYECALLVPARTFGYSMDNLDLLGLSLDELTVSLDDPSLQTRVGQAVGFNSLYEAGPFTGLPLAAEMETGDHMLVPYRMAFVDGVRPYVDASNVTVCLKTRDRPSDTLSVDDDEAMEAHGMVPKRSCGRFHRALVKVAADTEWDYAQGVEFLFREAGFR